MRGNKRWMGVGFMLLLTVCLAGGGCGKGTQDGMDDGRGGSEAVSDREEGGASEGRREGDGDSGMRAGFPSRRMRVRFLSRRMRAGFPSRRL